MFAISMRLQIGRVWCMCSCCDEQPLCKTLYNNWHKRWLKAEVSSHFQNFAVIRKARDWENYSKVCWAEVWLLGMRNIQQNVKHLGPHLPHDCSVVGAEVLSRGIKKLCSWSCHKENNAFPCKLKLCLGFLSSMNYSHCCEFYRPLKCSIKSHSPRLLQ